MEAYFKTFLGVKIFQTVSSNMWEQNNMPNTRDFLLSTTIFLLKNDAGF